MDEKLYRTFEHPVVNALLYHAAILLLLAELAYDIVLGGRLRLAGLQTADIALLLILGILGMTDPKFQRQMTSPLAGVFFLAVLGYSVLGFLFGNDLGWIRTDLRILMWTLGGFGLLSILLKTRNPAIHMLITLLVTTALMHLAAQSSLSVHFAKSRFDAGMDRLYGLNLFTVGIIQAPLLGIYLTVFARKSFFHLLCALALCLVFVYYIIYLSATRNLLLSFAAMIAAALPYFMLEKRNGLATYGWSPPRLALLALGIVLLIGSAGAMQSSLVFERFQGGDFMRESSARGRIEELMSVYHSFDKVALISGSGLGTVFRPYAGYQANFLHLGLFTFLFKFGVLGFTFIALLFYALIPGLMVIATFARKMIDDHRRTALLLALPVLMPWIVQVSISSGFTTYNFMHAGLALALFVEIDRNGLSRLLGGCKACG